MNHNIKGVGVALVTPFTATGEVDYPALERLVNHVIEGGVDYLVILGTTGEPATMTEAEKSAVVDCIVKTNGKRLPMVIGIGGNNTEAVESQILNFDFSEFTALLSVTPYYNKPSQEGLYQHYKRVAKASPVPVILYNVPGRTGVNMTAETTLRLAHEFKNIVAIKEACGSTGQIGYILRDKPADFMVISGDDNDTLPFIAMGGDGVISVAANAYPAKFSRMVKAALAGNFAEAAPLHLDMIEAVDALFAEGNPVGVKSALATLEVIENNLRLPLVKSSPALDVRIKALIDKYELAAY